MKNTSSSLGVMAWHEMVAVVGGVAGAGVYSALVDPETIPIALVVGLGTIAPSLTFLIVAWFTEKTWRRHLSYWLTTTMVMALLFWAYLTVPVHEGADDIVRFVTEVFAVASVSAYPCVVFAQGKPKT